MVELVLVVSAILFYFVYYLFICKLCRKGQAKLYSSYGMSFSVSVTVRVKVGFTVRVVVVIKLCTCTFEVFSLRMLHYASFSGQQLPVSCYLLTNKHGLYLYWQTVLLLIL